MWQIALDIFDIFWLCMVLWLLFAIWRASLDRTQRVDKALLDAVQISAESARKSADAAYLLAERQSHEGYHDTR